MTSQAEEQAARLLTRTRLVDGHNDLPFVIWQDRTSRGDVRRWDLRADHKDHDTDIPKLIAGQVATQIFTAFIPTSQNDPLKARLEVIDVMLQLEQAYPDVFEPVLAPSDIRRAQRMGKIGLFKAVEGLVGVASVAHLRLFHAMGIRLITLCHNERLPFVDSATDQPGPEPLTEFGREIVAEMERLGLIIDLAHVSAEAQHKVLDVATGPVLISHANARALCPHPRNAPDDVMRRIADGGGIVMATFVPTFMAPLVFETLKPAMDAFGKSAPSMDRASFQTLKRAAFEHFKARDGIQYMADHLDYMRNLIGPEAIGIGSDFYGGPNPPGLDDASTFPRLFAELIRRKWKTRDLERLAGGNFERVWQAVHRAAPILSD
ncbi:COG2355 Zn-dependent dipeptidase, microsomal dipeptidase homolog [Rhabdaerophilaceae bacterium]